MHDYMVCVCVCVCFIVDMVNSYPACCHRRGSVRPTWQLVHARVSEGRCSLLYLVLEAGGKNPESSEIPSRTHKKERKKNLSPEQTFPLYKVFTFVQIYKHRTINLRYTV